jgi:hypothetical protein
LQEERIAKDLRNRGKRRTEVQKEIVGQVTCIQTNMQEFVNKQLPSWLNKGVLSELRSLPKPLLAITLEQIREVI